MTSKFLVILCLLALLPQNTVSLFKFWPFSDSSQKWDSNAVTLVPLQEVAPLRFVTTVSLGEPPQQFKVLVDTYNSIFWVYSKQCYSYVCWQRKTYSHDASSDYVPVGIDQKLTYPFTADITGYLSTDVVQLLGFQTSITFNEITSISIQGSEDNILFDQIDGVMPLGWQHGEKIEVPSIFQALKNKYPNIGDSFSLYFGHQNEPNYLILGGTDSHYYNDKLTYHQVLSDFGWGIQLNGIKIHMEGNDNLKSHEFEVKFAKTALIVAGIPFIYGPQQDMDRIVSFIDIKSDCSNIDELPKVSLNIENVEYLLTPQDYVIKSVVQGGRVFGNLGASVRTCQLAFRSSVTVPLYILGSAFIRAYYTHFDFEYGRVGFAKAKRFN